MSMLPRVGTLQSANRVLMLNGPIPRTIGETLTIMDFIKQSPEGMMALERHLLGLEDAMALQEASSILEQVTLDLALVLKTKQPKHRGVKPDTDAPHTTAPRLAGFDLRAGERVNPVRPVVPRLVPSFVPGVPPPALKRAAELASLEDVRPAKRPGVNLPLPPASMGFPAHPLAGMNLAAAAGFPPAAHPPWAPPSMDPHELDPTRSNSIHDVSNAGIQRAARVASVAAAQAAAAGAPPQAQIIQALMTTLHQDPAAAAAGPEPDAELTGPITVRLVDELRVRLLLNVPLPLTGAWLGMHRQGDLAIADHKIGEAARCRRLPEKPDPDGVLVTCTELRGLDDGPYTFVLYAGVTPTATTDAVDFRGGRFAPEGEA